MVPSKFPRPVVLESFKASGFINAPPSTNSPGCATYGAIRSKVPWRVSASTLVDQISNAMHTAASAWMRNDLLCKRFLQGKITAEQFLKKMDYKMRMIEREN